MFQRIFILVFAIGLVLSGCSLDAQKEPAVPRAATKVEDMLKEGPGKFSGTKYDQEKVEAALDQFPDNLSEEEAYDRVVQLLAEDYQPLVKRVDSFDPTIEVETTAKPGDIEAPVENVKKMNVAILLDASGSMAGRVPGGMKMDLAKKSIKKFASSLPEGVNVSLLVYGHKGTSSGKDKKLSCGSIETVYPLGNYNEDSFQQALNRFDPKGWTPLGAAIETAQKDLQQQTGDNVQNIIYVVSDGVETCGGDPVKAAKELHQSDIEAVINIIGFDVDDEGQKALKKVADAGGGSYKSVDTEEDLSQYFIAAYEELRNKWREWSKENQQLVDQGDTANQLLLFELVRKDALGLLDTEIEHFDHAFNYLKKKKKVTGTFKMKEKSADRDKKIRSYFVKRINEIKPIIQQEQEKQMEEIEKIRRQKEEEINQKIEELEG